MDRSAISMRNCSSLNSICRKFDALFVFSDLGAFENDGDIGKAERLERTAPPDGARRKSASTRASNSITSKGFVR